MVESWAEHLRQHSRVTDEDAPALDARADFIFVPTLLSYPTKLQLQGHNVRETTRSLCVNAQDLKDPPNLSEDARSEEEEP